MSYSDKERAERDSSQSDHEGESSKDEDDHDENDDETVSHKTTIMFTCRRCPGKLFKREEKEAHRRFHFKEDEAAEEKRTLRSERQSRNSEASMFESHDMVQPDPKDSSHRGRRKRAAVHHWTHAKKMKQHYPGA